MKVTYDPQAMMMYVYKRQLNPGERVFKTEPLAPGLVVDYDRNGKVLGYEIWGGPLELEVLS